MNYLFVSCALKTCSYALKQCLLNLKYYFLCGRLSIIERWRVVSFCPHATSAGVFGINLRAVVPIVGSFEGGAQHNEPGNRTIMLEHSHLAIELYNFKFRRSPKFRRPSSGRYPCLGRTKPAPRSKRHKSLGTQKTSRTATGLSPHHDKQF